MQYSGNWRNTKLQRFPKNNADVMREEPRYTIACSQGHDCSCRHRHTIIKEYSGLSRVTMANSNGVTEKNEGKSLMDMGSHPFFQKEWQFRLGLQ
jgi:hypothetical protein